MESGDLLSIEDAAHLLAVHPGTVGEWVREGRIPAVRIGRKKWRIHRTDLERMVTERHAQLTVDGASVPATLKLLHVGESVPPSKRLFGAVYPTLPLEQLLVGQTATLLDTATGRTIRAEAVSLITGSDGRITCILFVGGWEDEIRKKELAEWVAEMDRFAEELAREYPGLPDPDVVLRDARAAAADPEGLGRQ